MFATVRQADRVVLYHISWEQFERLLEDLGDCRAARIAYDNGTLEIMTPLPEREYFKETIGDAVKEISGKEFTQASRIFLVLAKTKAQAFGKLSLP